MNKTVTVNIGGMVFHIEEQAYDKLRKYLDAIRGYFTSSDGRDEIIQDIESRIAEIFTERIGTSRQVVTEADAEFMISAMGRPEQVAGEDEDQSERYSRTTAQDFSDINDRGYRKLYRDPDDKVIGGVCSGISHYLGVDPIWLRLILGVAFFFYGSGFLLYIILLVIIPKAKTTTEKLEMKGKPVNIESIRRTIEDEVVDLKNRFSGDAVKTQKTKATNGIARFFEVLGQLLVNLFKVGIKVLGGFAMIILVIVLISMFFLILSMTGIIGNTEFPVELSYLFLDKTQLTLAIITIVLLAGVPILALLYRLIRATFNIKSDTRILNYASGVLWTIGVIIGVFLFISISRNYKVYEKERVDINILQPQTDTLYLEGSLASSYEDKYADANWNFGDAFYFNETRDSVIISRVKLDVVQATGTQFELEKIVTGRGSDRHNAQDNIRNVDYEISQIDSTLKFAESFRLATNQRFRNQKIQLILKVPVGKSIYLNNNIENIIYDIKNVTNTYDRDMTGHVWTMTPNGLECIGCNLSDRNHNGQMHIRVNGEDVNIDTDDADTIDWNKKDVKVHINEQGVIIDARDTDKGKSGKEKSW